MSINKDEAVQALGNMTVMQLIALTKELEEKWGVKAQPQFQTVALPDNTKPEVQTEFSVVMVSFPADKKMSVVKAVKEHLGLGLMESKTLVEGLPKTVREGASKEEANELQVKLAASGAVVEVK